MSSVKVIYEDKYRYESKDETIITKNYSRSRQPSPSPPPPKPITTSTTTVETTYYRPLTPPPPVTTTTTTITTSYPKSSDEPVVYRSSMSPRVSRIGTTRLYRTPSLHSIRVHSQPRITYVSPPRISYRIPVSFQNAQENVIRLSIEKENVQPVVSYNETFESSFKSRS